MKYGNNRTLFFVPIVSVLSSYTTSILLIWIWRLKANTHYWLAGRMNGYVEGWLGCWIDGLVNGNRWVNWIRGRGRTDRQADRQKCYQVLVVATLQQCLQG